MITKYILEFIVFIMGSFFNILSGVLPGLDYLDTLSTALGTLLGVSTQVSNFLYFIFGEFYYTAVILVGIIIPFKLIAVPVLSFVRKFIAWG